MEEEETPEIDALRTRFAEASGNSQRLKIPRKYISAKPKVQVAMSIPPLPVRGVGAAS